MENKWTKNEGFETCVLNFDNNYLYSIYSKSLPGSISSAFAKANTTDILVLSSPRSIRLTWLYSMPAKLAKASCDKFLAILYLRTLLASMAIAETSRSCDTLQILL